jgi:hypothetical protein
MVYVHASPREATSKKINKKKTLQVKGGKHMIIIWYMNMHHQPVPTPSAEVSKGLY